MSFQMWISRVAVFLHGLADNCDWFIFSSSTTSPIVDMWVDIENCRVVFVGCRLWSKAFLCGSMSDSLTNSLRAWLRCVWISHLHNQCAFLKFTFFRYRVYFRSSLHPHVLHLYLRYEFRWIDSSSPWIDSPLLWHQLLGSQSLDWMRSFDRGMQLIR